MRVVFSGSFNRDEETWKYEFFLPDTALIVNAWGGVTFSCPEVVIDVSDETNKMEWLWKDRAKVERTKDAVTVSIHRGEWMKAASFTKEAHEI